jgi:hypothetical protein
MRVSVVATFHATKGLVTTQALYQLLERIRPEVIFLEIPSTAFPDYLAGRRSNLESTTARLYSEGNQVVLVPVDSPTPDLEFWEHNEELFRRVEGASTDYRRLHDNHIRDMAVGGFHYLNSGHSSKALAAEDLAMQASLRELNDSRLFELYRTWQNINDLRENTMLKGIVDYAVLHPFERGALLVGVAHRQPMLDKCRVQHNTGIDPLEWDFTEFLLP